MQAVDALLMMLSLTTHLPSNLSPSCLGAICQQLFLSEPWKTGLPLTNFAMHVSCRLEPILRCINAPQQEKLTLSVWCNACLVQERANTRVHLRSMKSVCPCRPNFNQAPEVLAGAKSSMQANVYAFGMLTYEVLLRKEPYQDEDHGVLAHSHPASDFDYTCCQQT